MLNTGQFFQQPPNAVADITVMSQHFSGIKMMLVALLGSPDNPICSFGLHTGQTTGCKLRSLIYSSLLPLFIINELLPLIAHC